MIAGITIISIFVAVTAICSLSALRGVTGPAGFFSLFFEFGALSWLALHHWRWEGWPLLLALVLASAWLRGREIVRASQDLK